MAADSENKRMSVVGVGLPFVVLFAVPDGTVGQPDRQSAAYAYAGITAGIEVAVGFVRELLATSLSFTSISVQSITSTEA